MKLNQKKIGVAVTGSFCMYEKMFTELQNLVNAEALVYPILSFHSQTISSRFGTPENCTSKVEQITGRKPILTIAEAEPIGPGGYLDALVILPCTGNTAAKLANGITDTPVLMAAKAHLRNNKPLIIAISTNDGLGANLKNIAALLNTKHIYFVPFGQDDCRKKPNSLIADLNLLQPTLELALEQRQYQPLLTTPH